METRGFMKIKEIIIAVTIVLLIAATGCYQIPVYLPPFGLGKDTTATDTREERMISLITRTFRLAVVIDSIQMPERALQIRSLERSTVTMP